jgi:hypothetical protein
VRGNAKSTAIINAVIAYEKLDLSALDSEQSALRDIPRAEALSVGAGVQRGERLLSEKDCAALKDSVWEPAIEVDSALYRGELGRAERALREWNEAGSSAYLTRMAELARYQGDAERALTLARRAAPEKNPRAFLEELQALVATGKASEALDLLKDAERSQVLGPLEKWTKNFVVGNAKSRGFARGTIGQLPMPSRRAPVSVRLMAARAMNTAGDLRGKSMVVLLEAVVPKHPMLELARRDLK